MSKIFKRLTAAAMAAIMMCAMAVAASAANYNVSVYNTETGEASKYSAVVAGQATTEKLDNGNTQVTIPLGSIEKSALGMTLKGYVADDDALAVTEAVTGTVSVTAPIYDDGEGYLTFEVTSMPSDNTFHLECNVAMYLGSTYITSNASIPGAPSPVQMTLVLAAAS